MCAISQESFRQVCNPVQESDECLHATKSQASLQVCLFGSQERVSIDSGFRKVCLTILCSGKRVDGFKSRVTACIPQEVGKIVNSRVRQEYL